jgi:hypothetical protein
MAGSFLAQPARIRAASAAASAIFVFMDKYPRMVSGMTIKLQPTSRHRLAPHAAVIVQTQF